MVFLGAFLLFGMEPLVGRLLAPFLGGAAHVWLICLMFYQAMLFAGYFYAHLFARKIGVWHLAVLFLPLVILPFDIQHLPDVGSPIGQLLTVLLTHAALPFIVLSTTAVVAQVWLSGSPLGKKYDPYPLYAASNAGSFVALFGYSLLIEPMMGLKIQSVSWTAVYLVYVVLACTSWFMLSWGQKADTLSSEKKSHVSTGSISPSLYLRWILLSALPSAFLLAVTNLIILEIGSFPLTWTIPLALYLLSFIVTFRVHGGTPGILKRLWPEIVMVALVFYLSETAHWHITIITLMLFSLICLIAHGTLYEIRPPSEHLTRFYLAIAFGGWLGGAAVSLVAPAVFSGLYEYPIVLVLIAAVFFWCRNTTIKELLPKFNLFGLLRAILIVLVITQVGRVIYHGENVRFHHRNFYGTYRVVDIPPTAGKQVGIRTLVHGSTLHGAQWLDGDERTNPISYYYRGGAISQAFSVIPSPRNIAIVGLGAGAAAAYAGEHDRVTFYEIDPDIEQVARRWFTYLGDSKAEQRVVVGDGRLSMQRDRAEHPEYNLVLIDAFTGDGIPVHLLTREAIGIYMASLAEGGLLLFHVSNRYYELRPLIKAIAREMNLHGAFNTALAKGQLRPEQIDTHCVALAVNRDSLQPLLDAGWVSLGEDEFRTMEPWTDDYINILEPLQEGIKTKFKAWEISLPF
jgi:hypothetical protein